MTSKGVGGKIGRGLLASHHRDRWRLPFTTAESAAFADYFFESSGGEGAAAAALTFTATAAGTRTVTATADATLGFTATAAGTRATVATAATAFTFTATASGAVGTPTITGTADATLTFTATALGVRTTSGSAAAPLEFTAAASSVLGITGTAATSITFTATAVAPPIVTGTAAAAVTLTATATRPQPRPASGVFDRFSEGLNEAIWEDIGGTPPVEGVDEVTFPAGSLIRTRDYFSLEGNFYAVGLTLDPAETFGLRLETLDVSDGIGYAGLTWRVFTDGAGGHWELEGRTASGEVAIDPFVPADWRFLRVESDPTDPAAVTFRRSANGYAWTSVASTTVGLPSLLREMTFAMGGAA